MAPAKAHQRRQTLDESRLQHGQQLALLPRREEETIPHDERVMQLLEVLAGHVLGAQNVLRERVAIQLAEMLAAEGEAHPERNREIVVLKDHIGDVLGSEGGIPAAALDQVPGFPRQLGLAGAAGVGRPPVAVPRIKAQE